ncbi:MAG: hypothetical protein IPJ98_16350 [Bryobacterales bacterium]|nr:hypothetical protein [Bryobacterales bacterium]
MRVLVSILSTVCAALCVAQQRPKEQLDALQRQTVVLYQAGKYVQAVGVSVRALELSEGKFGPDRSI